MNASLKKKNAIEYVIYLRCLKYFPVIGFSDKQKSQAFWVMLKPLYS